MFKRTAKRQADTSITLPTTYRVALSQSGQTLAEFSDRESALRYSDYVGRTFLVGNYVHASK